MANFFGTTGHDVQDGTGADDAFDYSQGGRDTLAGLEGGDMFLFGRALTAADRIDGGTGDDTVVLNGAYDIVFSATTIVGVEQIDLVDGHDYALTLDDANVAAGEVLRVEGGSLLSDSHLYFYGGAETDGSLWVFGGEARDVIAGGQGSDVLDGFHGRDSVWGMRGDDFLDGAFGRDLLYGSGGDDLIRGDAGPDVLKGGNGADEISGWDGDDFVAGGNGRDQLRGELGADKLSGGAKADALLGSFGRDILIGGLGSDTFYYVSPSESEAPFGLYDWIKDFDTSADKFFFGLSPVGGIDATIEGGALSAETFGTDLEAAADAAHLAAHHAVIFLPDAGDLAGRVYLLVDSGSTAGAGFQDEHDCVIDLTGGTGIIEGGLTLDNFI